MSAFKPTPQDKPMVDLLLSGNEFTKYPYRSKGNSRTMFVCVSEDFHKIRWGKKHEILNSKSAGKYISIMSKKTALTSIQKGRQTGVFQRYPKQNGEDISFSIISKKRSLDLEIMITDHTNTLEDMMRSRDLWFNAFEWLLNNQPFIQAASAGRVKGSRSMTSHRPARTTGGSNSSSVPSHRPSIIMEEHLDTPDFKSMDDGEIDRAFEELMEKLLIGDDKKNGMRSMNRDNKILILSQENIKSKQQKEEPSQWIAKLNEDPSENMLRELSIVLRGEGKEWMSEFEEDEGIKALLPLLELEEHYKKPGRILNVLQCFEALMNNEFSLEMILGTDHTIDGLASVLKFGDDKMRLKVIKLLTVVIFVDNNAHMSVLRALGSSKFGRRFKILIEILDQSDDVDMKLTTMTFINMLINACETLEERVQKRHEFLSLDWHNVMYRLRQFQSLKRGDLYTEEVEKLWAQINWYTEEESLDQKDVMYDGLGNMSDIDQLFQYLKTWSIKDGYISNFLEALQFMVAIPDQKERRDNVWNNIKFAFELILDDDEDESNHEKLTYEGLATILDERRIFYDRQKHEQSLQIKLDETVQKMHEQKKFI